MAAVGQVQVAGDRAQLVEVDTIERPGAWEGHFELKDCLLGKEGAGGSKKVVGSDRKYPRINTS
jgi:hypothetical protein